MLCQCVKLTLCIVVMLFLYSESLFNPRSPLKRPVEIELILESAIFKSTNWFIPWKTVSGRKLMWLVSTSRIFSLVKLRMLGGRRVSQVLVMWSSCNKIENLTINDYFCWQNVVDEKLVWGSDDRGGTAVERCYFLGEKMSKKRSVWLFSRKYCFKTLADILTFSPPCPSMPLHHRASTFCQCRWW